MTEKLGEIHNLDAERRRRSTEIIGSAIRRVYPAHAENRLPHDMKCLLDKLNALRPIASPKGD